MEINGVTSLTKQTLKSFRVGLDARLTDGHDFVELIIDEDNKSFTARLYGNEVYTNSWQAPGEDFICFLITCFADDSRYLFSKIANHSLDEFVDIDRTVERMKERVLSQRKNSQISEEVAREAYDLAHELSQHEDMRHSHFYQIFQPDANEEVFGSEPWHDDFIVSKRDQKAKVFCEKVAPILADVLRKEYELS